VRRLLSDRKDIARSGLTGDISADPLSGERPPQADMNIENAVWPPPIMSLHSRQSPRASSLFRFSLSGVNLGG
jgi:hypothetical protein